MSSLCLFNAFPPRQFIEGDFEEYLSKLQDPQVRQQWNSKSVRAAPPTEVAVQSLLLWFHFSAMGGRGGDQRAGHHVQVCF